jgi:hypothetical protein
MFTGSRVFLGDHRISIAYGRTSERQTLSTILGLKGSVPLFKARS